MASNKTKEGIEVKVGQVWRGPGLYGGYHVVTKQLNVRDFLITPHPEVPGSFSAFASTERFRKENWTLIKDTNTTDQDA